MTIELIEVLVLRLGAGFCLERLEVGVEAEVFGLERVGADLIAVVELEQLAARLIDVGDLTVSLRLEPAGVPSGRPAVLQTLTDRGPAVRRRK